jgi:hypothetical protein
MAEGWQVDRKQIWELTEAQRQELERMGFRARLILECDRSE